jgi:2-keto-4-pentenoate hydratase
VSAALSDPRIAAGMRSQLELRNERLASGARQVGWKVGFGAPAAKDKLRLDAPLVGFVLDRALLPPGAQVSLAGWRKPVAEPEIAVYLGRDLGPGADDASARDAIAALGPAVELADIDGPMDDVQSILSGDIFQRHVLLGPRDDGRAGIRLDGLSATVRRGGDRVPVPADLEAPTGRIAATLRHVAELAAALGDRLRAGQFVICGSLTPPLFLDPSDTEIDYALAPVGAVSVRFSH